MPRIRQWGEAVEYREYLAWLSCTWGYFHLILILLNRNLLPLTANSAVTIPAGVTVVVDVQLPQLTSITVDGTLVLRNLGTPQNIQVRGR